MMLDDITLEHIDTQNQYDLQQLLQNDVNFDELSDSPFDLCQNTCLYYEPQAVSKIFSKSTDEFSVFCLNCQGLRSHWCFLGLFCAHCLG